MRVWEIHPAVVHFPIAFLLGGVALDLFGRHSETAVTSATYLLLAGLATAAVAAVTGVVAYYTVPGNHTEQAHGASTGTSGDGRGVRHVRGGLPRALAAPTVVSPAIRGVGLAAAAILLFGGYVGGKLVYQGGLGIDPAILKPGLRSKIEANNSPPAGPTDPVMAMNFDKPAEH